jgi:uncharacterized protein RhaS with RHS repeats
LTKYRVYDPKDGRWLSRDPIGEAGGINLYAYVGGNPVNWIDPLGLSGILIIFSDKGLLPENASSGSGGTSGHSWISYTPDDTGVTTTYGTWGYGNAGAALYEGREDGRLCGGTTACRQARLDDDEEARLLEVINNYRNNGTNAWGYFSPCSSFAANAWNTSTSESLSPYGPYSNPTSLYNAIVGANGGYLEGQRPAPVEDNSIVP